MVLDFVDPDGTGTATLDLQRRYLYGEAVDQILAQEDITQLINSPSRVLFPLTDHLGTVRDLVRNDASIATHFVYDSFGAVLSGNTSLTRYLFTSREFDADTNLQTNRARYYDPMVGRFISHDPLSFAAGDANTYRYVGNNATNFIDPSGLEEDVWLGVGAEPTEAYLKEKIAEWERLFPTSPVNLPVHTPADPTKVFGPVEPAWPGGTIENGEPPTTGGTIHVIQLNIPLPAPIIDLYSTKIDPALIDLELQKWLHLVDDADPGIVERTIDLYKRVVNPNLGKHMPVWVDRFLPETKLEPGIDVDWETRKAELEVNMEFTWWLFHSPWNPKLKKP